jgi:predicted RNA-binding Zn ribbon-like protein
MAKNKRSATAATPLRRDKPTTPPAESVDAERVLAFVNTLSSRPLPEPVERLTSYDALVGWAREQHLISAAAADRLLAEARRHPHQAGAVLSRAREFREALNELAQAVEQKRQPSAAVLQIISDALADAYAHGRLVPHDGALQWIYAPRRKVRVAGAQTDEDDLDRVLWEISRAAGRLVLSPRLAKVRSCAASDCAWWFVDDTKNRSRRWCDMKICGNREKVRRFRQKN